MSAGARRGETEQLSDLLLFVELDVSHALQSAVVMGSALDLFHKAPDIFHTNPANTLAFAALKALEDRAIVRIADIFKDDNQLYPIARTFARRGDLINHRDALSHPYLVKWGRKAMQAFAAAHRQWLDNRSVLVWETYKELLARLEAAGRGGEQDPCPVHLGLASLLRAIFVSSFTQKQLAAWTPNEYELLDSLRTFRDAYLKYLEDKLGDEAPNGGA